MQLRTLEVLSQILLNYHPELIAGMCNAIHLDMYSPLFLIFKNEIFILIAALVLHNPELVIRPLKMF